MLNHVISCHSYQWKSVRKGELVMKNTKTSKPMAKAVANALNGVLRADANSTACFVAYQPKAPKELARFRKSK